MGPTNYGVQLRPVLTSNNFNFFGSAQNADPAWQPLLMVTSGAIGLSLIDPVPQYVGGNGSITASLSMLASATQTVGGVSADGVARVVVRISGAQAGDRITLTLQGRDR